MYNFFEESELDSLWKYLIDEDKSKLRVPNSKSLDSKYVPLIHEVSDTPFSRQQKPYFLAFEAQMSVCRHY